MVRSTLSCRRWLSCEYDNAGDIALPHQVAHEAEVADAVLMAVEVVGWR
jgi:hypothetical protein